MRAFSFYISQVWYPTDITLPPPYIYPVNILKRVFHGVLPQTSYSSHVNTLSIISKSLRKCKLIYQIISYPYHCLRRIIKSPFPHFTTCLTLCYVITSWECTLSEDYYQTACKKAILWGNLQMQWLDDNYHFRSNDRILSKMTRDINSVFIMLIYIN